MSKLWTRLEQLGLAGLIAALANEHRYGWAVYLFCACLFMQLGDLEK